MLNTWLTADWHLGETRLELIGRPFKSSEEHIEALIKYHNELVKPLDYVIHVGDVCYQKTPEMLPLVAKFNGCKTLIRGNHDRGIPDEEFLKYFDMVIPEGQGLAMEVDLTPTETIPLYVTHYPTLGVFHRFNLVGHIHAAWKYQLNMLNVGVDVHHFRPVNLNRIPFHFNAVKDFYDKDVWVGYNEVNSVYLGKRGKQDSYFDASKHIQS